MSNQIFEKNLSVTELTKLIEKLESSPFNYLAVEDGENKIVIGKEVVPTINSTIVANTVAQEAAPVAQAVAVAEKPEVVEEVVAEPVQQKQKVEVPEQEGVVTITASTTGIYYAQSEPGAAPYVKVGDKVSEDSTVGLIEIMKVFSAIPAGVEGEVVAIHVEDAQLVEYGDALISVKVK
ncbi:acetyl-CoA carboxylase biotin carboxyl carrier protein [Lysinibacillus endophyticus]|uniref:Lipoyl-binding domain-containing protein n=1 Tax=Ureibacillus endophyticus TaxID=1978490 RepID=A0A494ZD82_9BACL|nr:biotin/lipoyl-containing protein [Lysinibacillus endophyticus]RKQ20095.1 hypothetical protein D8M03_00660 [Lysinibacillus endophyticus]